ncbi:MULTISPECIES: hypothetical protein [unclassified Sulfitobacter]|uniref:hypothetical protein n=1 Tax=unclassified Sulfitobacter TaxID=196795 RepID=UPI0015938708|nr:hypothetical protein [Sulfitobacter sp. HGT1]MBQ0805185.1 hypothetical protein [Sulfitobacter sp.]
MAAPNKTTAPPFQNLVFPTDALVSVELLADHGISADQVSFAALVPIKGAGRGA